MVVEERTVDEEARTQSQQERAQLSLIIFSQNKKISRLQLSLIFFSKGMLNTFL